MKRPPYDVILDTLHDGVLVIGQEEVIEYANAAALRILGFERPDQFTGRHLGDLKLRRFTLDGTEVVEHDAAFRQTLLEGGVQSEVLYRYEGLPRGPIWIESNITAIPGETGYTVVIGMADVTGRVEATLAHQQDEVRLQEILNASPIGIMFLDVHGTVEMANPAAEQLLRLQRSAMEGRPGHDATYQRITVDGAPLPLEEVPVAVALREGRVVRDHVHGVVRGDGSVIWLRVTAAPLLRRDGSTSGVVALFSDCTEELRLRKERMRAERLEAIGRLAGGVAHDFNNLLAVIGANADLLLWRLGSDSPHRSTVDMIRTATSRSADLTRQLLAFARQQSAEPKPLDLNEAIGGMLKMLRRIIGEDIDIVWKPGNGLWTTWLDPTQVDQVLANLLVNARDAIAGKGQVSIETENLALDAAYCSHIPDARPGEFVMLSVADDGCGMDPKVQARVFEPFFTTKGIGQGTGLGLATVYGIVQQNQGFIHLYSERGRGTIFRLYFPRHRGTAVQVVPPQAEAEKPCGHETILLVEDTGVLLRTLEDLLQSLGYQVLTARSGEEAVQVAEAHKDRIDLVLTDLVMPGMTGHDLVQTLLTSRPDLKSLYMSGYPYAVIAQKGFPGEGVHYLQKPFGLPQLARRLREALGQETP